MWVAIDRGASLLPPLSRIYTQNRNTVDSLSSVGIRLAEKRSLPCPRRNEWYAARDTLYEEIMAKGYNKEKQFFAQSYEDQDVLDSSLLIMPLVFFSTPVSRPSLRRIVGLRLEFEGRRRVLIGRG